MKYYTTQKELIDLLNNNDLNVKCYFEEITEKSNEYIFIRRLNDNKIYADGKPYATINRIELNVYSKSIIRRAKICRFIDQHFNKSFSYVRDGDVFKASTVLNLIVGDWHDQ